MRGFTAAVGGSVVVHAFVLAILAARDPVVLPPVAVEAPPTPVEVVPPAPSSVASEPPPIEVVFIDEVPPPADARTAAGARATAGVRVAAGGRAIAAATEAPPARQRGRVVRPGSTGTEAPGGSTPGIEGPPSRSPYMTMRKPGEEGLQGPSGGFLDDFLARSKPLPPPPDIPGERVGNEIADLRAKLKRAGRYSSDELMAMRAELVRLTQERDAEELKSDGGGTYKSEKLTFKAKVAADGKVKLDDGDLGGMDKFMKEHGADPYRANKLNYLDRTRDQRVAIGNRYRAQELEKSVIYMQQNIARLWAMTTDVAKRKQGLFDLWDECAETGTPEEIAGGEAARAFVMNHIRATVRYTADELRALNATRHSKQPFAP